MPGQAAAARRRKTPLDAVGQTIARVAAPARHIRRGRAANVPRSSGAAQARERPEHGQSTALQIHNSAVYDTGVV